MAEKLPPPAREEGVAADVDIAWVGPTQIGGNLGVFVKGVSLSNRTRS
jgi:hypothetical protein